MRKMLSLILSILILLLTLAPVALPARADDGGTSIADLEVIDTVPFDLIAGPGSTGGYFSADGQHFAYFAKNELCIYTVAGEKGVCANLLADEARIRPDLESVRWSPDGKMLAFTENFLQFFTDSDLWVMDAESGAVKSLTPDPSRTKKIISNKDPEVTFTIDIHPQWSPDSQTIYFMRYFFKTLGDAVPTIYAIPATGGEAVPVLSTEMTAIASYSFAVSPDGQRFAYNADTRMQPPGGTWLADRDGGNRILAYTPDQPPLLPWAYTFSADGRYVLTIGYPGGFNTPTDPAISVMRVISSDGSEVHLVDSENLVASAGWSPTGSALVYTVTNMLKPEVQGLYLSEGPGKPGRMILPGRYMVPTGRLQMPLTWSAENTILVTNMEGFKLMLVKLGKK